MILSAVRCAFPALGLSNNLSRHTLRWAGPLVLAHCLDAMPAKGCTGAGDCGSTINPFFVSLIASSLTAADRASGGAAAALPGGGPPSRLPTEPVVIKPPPRPAGQPNPVKPGRRLSVIQRLVAGPVLDNGIAHQVIHDDAARTDEPDNTAPPPDLTVPPVSPEDGDGLVWQMTHLVLLPHHAVWPLGTVRQPVEMKMTCGACGRQGDVAHFSGSAQFTLFHDIVAEGRIEAIALVSADGLTANGDLSFQTADPLPHLVYDPETSAFLEIGGRQGELTGSLAAWFDGHSRVRGLFSAIPVDEASGFGAIVGQFNGAACAPPCGVEN